MRFLERRVYVGPNQYALYPVVRLTIDLGPMEEFPSHSIEGFTDGLLEAVPSLWEHKCCFTEPGGFVRRLREGTWMGHIIEHVAIALQNLGGQELAFGKTRGTGREGEYHIVFAAPDGEVGLRAADAARRIVESLLPPELAGQWDVSPADIDPRREIDDFLRFARRRLLDPSTRAVVEAAKERGIPVLALTGTNGKTTTARMLSHMYQTAGRCVGMTSTDGVYLDDELIIEGDMTGPKGARAVLDNPDAEVAVLEVARGGILRSGMGVPRVDVGALMNVTDDHLGMDGIDDLDGLAFVKSTVPKVATGTAVLNADDPHCLRWADGCKRAERICLVSRDRTSTAVIEHLRAGGPAVVLEALEDGRQSIVLYDQGTHTCLIDPDEIPATLEGAVQHNVDNAMFAVAMAWSQGLAMESILEGLRTFEMSFEKTPGRLNIHDGLPFRVIMDYGHNPAGYRAMGDVVDRLAPAGRRICVFGTRASRRDQEIRACAREVARHFDVFYCRGEHGEYGRPRDEVPRMQRGELLAAGVPEEAVEAVVDEPVAIQRALDRAEPGDLVVVFASDLARAWDQIRGHRSDRGESSAVRAQPKPDGERRTGSRRTGSRRTG